MVDIYNKHFKPTYDVLTTHLPHITLNEWLKLKYKTDTKFYFGWSLNNGAVVFICGWDPSLSAVYGWGNTGTAGYGWVEIQMITFLYELENHPTECWEIFRSGPKTASEINQLLGVYKINCEDHSTITLPNGTKLRL